MEITKQSNTYKRFQPTTLIAINNIKDLLSRGGTILVDDKEYVEIKRQESIAKIDRLGRVEWRPMLPTKQTRYTK